MSEIVVLSATVIDELIPVSLLSARYSVKQLLFTLLHLLGNGSLNRLSLFTRPMMLHGKARRLQRLVTIGETILWVNLVMAWCRLLHLSVRWRLTGLFDWWRAAGLAGGG